MTFNTNPDGQRVQCRCTRTGPKVGYRVVAWRARCRNMTTDRTGFCHVHRPKEQ